MKNQGDEDLHEIWGQEYKDMSQRSRSLYSDEQNWE